MTVRTYILQPPSLRILLLHFNIFPMAYSTTWTQQHSRLEWKTYAMVHTPISSSNTLWRHYKIHYEYGHNGKLASTIVHVDEMPSLIYYPLYQCSFFRKRFLLFITSIKNNTPCSYWWGMCCSTHMIVLHCEINLWAFLHMVWSRCKN
jgi:hypothetical protein